MFTEQDNILLHSLGDYHADMEEAKRRFSLYVNNLPILKNYRPKDGFQVAYKKHSWSVSLWEEEYYHYHDGLTTRGSVFTVSKITEAEFQRQITRSEENRRLMESKYGPWVSMSLLAGMEIHPGVELPASTETHHIWFGHIVARNFLGMDGCFDIEKYDYD